MKFHIYMDKPPTLRPPPRHFSTQAKLWQKPLPPPRRLPAASQTVASPWRKCNRTAPNRASTGDAAHNVTRNALSLAAWRMPCAETWRMPCAERLRLF